MSGRIQQGETCFYDEGRGVVFYNAPPEYPIPVRVKRKGFRTERREIEPDENTVWASGGYQQVVRPARMNDEDDFVENICYDTDEWERQVLAIQRGEAE